MNALATIRQAPGLDRYLDLLEHRLESAVAAIPGRLGDVGADTLAAGGKRLRPLLVFLSTPPQKRESERAVAGGAAVELVHMATLVHDDLLDGADLRRGRPTVWAEHGEDTARAAGDYLFARAFAQLAETGDAEAVAILSEATLALARGEAMQRRQAFRPETSVEIKKLLPLCGLKARSTLLKVKTGTILLVTIPLSAFGPAKLRNASCWKSCAPKPQPRYTSRAMTWFSTICTLSGG